jgi:hypothetical protein
LHAIGPHVTDFIAEGVFAKLVEGRGRGGDLDGRGRLRDTLLRTNRWRNRQERRSQWTKRAGKEDERGGGEVEFTPSTGLRAPTGPRGRRAAEEVVREEGAQALSKREGRLITPWKPYRAPATA